MSPARTVECPHCGYAMRAGRAACPACGSDAETGWRSSADVDYLSVEIPDDWDDTDQDKGAPSPNSTARRVGAILLVVLLLVAVSIPLLVRLL